jgi:hypothetical protein
VKYRYDAGHFIGGVALPKKPKRAHTTAISGGIAA